MARMRRRTWRFMDLVEFMADYSFKFGGFILLIFVGYLLYGLFTGGLSGLSSLPASDRARVMTNVSFACRMVFFLGLLFTFGVVVRFRREEGLGYLLAVVGFVFFYGVPAVPVIPALLPEKLRPQDLQNPATALVFAQLKILGLTFLVPGIFFTVLELIDKVRGLWSQKPTGKLVWGEEAKTRKPPIYGSCWDMVFCREFIREFCPAYTAGKACWKVKCGCYCDERTILQALKYQGTGGGFAKDVAYSMETPTNKKLSPAEKRERCRNCVLYMEHQRQKYQLLTPIVMIGVGVFIWQIYPILKLHMKDFINSVDKFMARVSYDPIPVVQTEMPAYVTGDGSQIVFLLFVVWLSIVILSYALRTLEYVVFKLKV